jgi:hypothetical protein
MSAWTADELDRFGEADEIEISSVRADGSLRPFIIIWAVRLGDGVYVRSALGPENGWFRRAKASGLGRIRVAGIEYEVAFETPGPEVAEPLHAAYHAKYDPKWPKDVDAVVSAESVGATLRLVPR